MSILQTPSNPCVGLEAQAQTAYNNWYRFKQKNIEAVLNAAIMLHKQDFCKLREIPKLLTCADVLELPGHTGGATEIMISMGSPCYKQNEPYVINEGDKAWKALAQDAVCSSLTPDFQPCYESTFRDAAQRVYACRDANKVPCPNFQWDSMAATKVPSPSPV